MSKPALANKWFVYYLEDPDEDMEGLDWDDIILFIDLKNNEINEGDTVLAISPFNWGWRDILWQESWQEWTKPLPSEAHCNFIKAVFQEF